MNNHKKIFNKIYEENVWEFGSGYGSIPENTEQYRWFLNNFIRTNNIKTVLDVGCGDWQISRMMDWTGLNYIGVDVSDVVLNNTKQFSSSYVKFIELDAVDDDLPSADLLIIKDVMQHWNMNDIFKFIPKLKTFSKALIINDPLNVDFPYNVDIDAGGYRPLDLSIEPFNLKGNYIFWFIPNAPKSVFLFTKD